MAAPSQLASQTSSRFISWLGAWNPFMIAQRFSWSAAAMKSSPSEIGMKMASFTAIS
jgi:hypothetical protein